MLIRLKSLIVLMVERITNEWKWMLHFRLPEELEGVVIARTLATDKRQQIRTA